MSKSVLCDRAVFVQKISNAFKRITKRKAFYILHDQYLPRTFQADDINFRMLPLLSLRVISVLLLPFSTATHSAPQELESDESTAVGTPLPTVAPNLPNDEYDFYHPHPAVHNDHYRKRSSGPWTLGVYICHDHGYSGKCETLKFTGKDDHSDDNPMRVLKGDINSIGPDVV